MVTHIALARAADDFSRSTVRSGGGSPSGEMKGQVTMKLHKDSHLDHHLTAAQLAHVLLRFDGRDAFFLETIELPDELGTVPCGLHGPIMGDSPVPDAEVTHARRGERTWTSRLVDRPARPTRQLTIIAGPHDGLPCVLYTVFGGPAAPQEPGDIRRQLETAEEERRERDGRNGDPASGCMDEAERAKLDPIYAKIVGLRTKRDVSDAFWREHALSR